MSETPLQNVIYFRAERAAKYQQSKEVEQAEREKAARIKEEAEKAMRNAAMNRSDIFLSLSLQI